MRLAFSFAPAVTAALAVVSSALLAFAFSACGPDQMGDDEVRASDLDAEPAADSSADAPLGTQRHIVTFRYGDDVPAERIDDITARFAALPDSIPGITAFEHGVNNSPEGLNKDITHAYVLTFADAAARDAYLPHPAHQRFVALLDGAVEDVFVIDYLVAE